MKKLGDGVEERVGERVGERGFFFVFFNRRILLHGKNSQKRDNMKKRYQNNKQPNVCTQIETKTKSIYIQ